MSTSSVRGGSAPQASPSTSDVRAPARSRKRAVQLAGEAHETLRAHQRGAEALDDRHQRLGEQRLGIAVADRGELAVGVRPWRPARAPRGAPARVSSSHGTSAAVPSSRVGEAGPLGGRVALRELAVQRHHRLGRREIQLREQDPIGGLDLRARLLVAGELRRRPPPRRRRRRRPPRPRAPRRAGRLSSPSRIDHGSAMPVVSSNDDLGLRAAHHLRDRRPQLRLHAHLVADAAAHQLHDVARAALDEARVDVDAPELVDDDADAPVVLAAEHAVERGRLPRAEEAGEQDERRFVEGWRQAGDTSASAGPMGFQSSSGASAPGAGPTDGAAPASGKAFGTQARTAAAISAVGRSRSTAHGPRSDSSARRA